VQTAMVRRVGRREERVLCSLESIRSAGADYFTTVLVRRVET
jgi:precorrin-2 methylase